MTKIFKKFNKIHIIKVHPHIGGIFSKSKRRPNLIGLKLMNEKIIELKPKD